MKTIKKILEQHREEGRFKPVKPHNVPSVAGVSPRPTSDSASPSVKEEKEMKGKDPCWKGYQMVGTKDKGGKKVPNCVPEEVQQEGAVPSTEKVISVKHKTSGKTLRISAAAADKYRSMGYHQTNEEVVNEMDKSQKSPAGWNIDDYDYNKGKWHQGKIMTAKDATTHARTELDRLFKNPKQLRKAANKLNKEETVVESDDKYHQKKDLINLASIPGINLGRDDKPKSRLGGGKDVALQAPDKTKNKAVFNKFKDRVISHLNKEETNLQKRAEKFFKDRENKPTPKQLKPIQHQGQIELKNKMKKEEVEQIDEISSDLAGKYLEKVAHDQTKKVGLKSNLYNKLEPKRQKGVDRALDRMAVKEATDSDGGPPTPAAASLTTSGQPVKNKANGQTKMSSYVYEGSYKSMATDKEEDERLAKRKSWKVEGKWKKSVGTVTDKSGAKHTPMSRARDLARQAAHRNMAEQSNVKPNPFTIPAQNPGKADKPVSDYVKARSAGSSTKNARARAAGAANPHMFESRQLEIVREARKLALKKKKQVTEPGSDDKYIADPELSSQITKSNP